MAHDDSRSYTVFDYGPCAKKHRGTNLKVAYMHMCNDLPELYGPGWGRDVSLHLPPLQSAMLDTLPLLHARAVYAQRLLLEASRVGILSLVKQALADPTADRNFVSPDNFLTSPSSLFGRKLCGISLWAVRSASR